MTIGADARPQLADEVAAHLRGAIMSGRLRPGRFIRLEEVARELGVSATPVREALVALRGEDLVDLAPRRGYVVNPLTEQDVRDVFWLQSGIAGELAARAAAKATPDDLARLRALDADLAAADTTAVERREFEFHRAVNLVADARKLSWFLNNATRYTPAGVYSSDPDWRTRTNADHAALLTALAAGNASGARAAMARHFTDGADRLIAHLTESGVWARPT
ncbi:GntR family transcriptional regulator [Umezawaea sp. Da 62-37]|uniref:GntR family transcriptional regulator n=1 Tax=Umezawaea sp. Da 62-37 TaxID=3075927 RepID=UPI0028F722B0|nr:GntR family transcriptional regulator [Umezawaea sp. Da 62-37]WNV88378.1 GntR family transcriptional regulator [Umezawaea sp. Da 62-37]